MLRTKRMRRGWARAAIVATALAVAVPLAAGPAAAERTPREELTRAEDYFLVADYATARQKVDALLDAGTLTGDDLRAAWVLRARCEVAQGNRGAAEDAFCAALRIDPRWRPDPSLFTTGELETFGRARSACGGSAVDGVPDGSAGERGASGAPVPGSVIGGAPSTAPSYLPPPAGAPSDGGTPWYRKKLVLGVVGGAAAAAAVLALSGGGGGGDGAVDLPGFPPLPAR